MVLPQMQSAKCFAHSQRRMILPFILAQSPDAWLRTKLGEIQTKNHVPAMAASMVRDDEIVATAVVGDRVAGRASPARLDDRFQIGSIMKVMTATLVGRMVDRGVLKWDTTLAGMFPELRETMRPEYRNVTVDLLLSHLSGMPYQPATPEGVTDAAGGDSLLLRRYEYVKAALKDTSVASPGTKFVYGGGPILVANYLERKLGKPYETLMAEEVFRPLRMTRSGFGNMSSPNRIDGPWEHAWNGTALQPVKPFASFDRESRSCVGRNGYSTAGDMARFARAHLLRSSGYLRPETWAHLQTSVPGGSYGPGLAIEPEAWCGKDVVWHSGSNGKNLAVLLVCRSRRVAWAIMTNAEGPGASAAYGEAERAISDHLKENGR